MNQVQSSLYSFLLREHVTKIKYSILILSMMASLGAEAQFKKGDKYLGGTLSASASSNHNNETDIGSNTKNSSFSISPTLGFFLNDKWMLGGVLGYSAGLQRYDNGTDLQKYKSHSFSANILSRRYFPLSDKFYFALEGSLGYSRWENSSNNSQDQKGYTVGIGVRPLFIFFPTANWGIEAGIGTLSYSHSEDLSYDFSSNYFTANYGGFNIGFAYYFRNGE